MNERKDRSKMDLRIFFSLWWSAQMPRNKRFLFPDSLLLIDEYNLNAAFLAAIRKDIIV